MINLSTAIQALCPGSEFTIQNDDYSTIEWHILEGKAPSVAEVEAALIKLQAEDEQIKAEAQIKKQEVLSKLGLTADEVAALLA